jgi:hypothetical protein
MKASRPIGRDGVELVYTVFRRLPALPSSEVDCWQCGVFARYEERARRKTCRVGVSESLIHFKGCDMFPALKDLRQCPFAL